MVNPFPVYGWGNCNLNQLGLLREGKKVNKPTLLSLSQIKAVTGTDERILFINHKNQIVEFKTVNKNKNASVELFEFKLPSSAKMLKCGYEHFVALTTEGKVYALGNPEPYGSFGFEGLGSNAFVPLSQLKDRFITEIATGAYCVYFLCKNGDLYGVGKNDVGELGTGDFLSVDLPFLIAKKIKKIFGGNASHHLFYIDLENNLYCVGENNFGQLGIGNKINQFRPVKLSFEGNKINEICTGYWHSIMLLEDKVWSCGFANYNGLGEENDALVFTKIPTLSEISLIQISCGEKHNLALTDKNELYFWGGSHYGQSGFEQSSNTKYVDLPQQVNISFISAIYKNLKIYSGVYNSFLCNQYLNSLGSDFLSLFEKKEFTDTQLNGIDTHKLLIETRTNQIFTEVEEILSQYSKKETEQFLYWVYSDEIRNEKIISQICLKFGIEDIHKKSLKNDLKNLYKLDSTKDFFILVSEENYNENENENDNDNDNENENDNDNDNENDNENDNDNEDEDKDEDTLEEIPIHKLILQARSGLFREMFLNIQQQTNKVQDYSGKSFETLEILFRFFYTDELLLTADDDPQLILEELDDAIDYYQLNKETNLIEELDRIQKQWIDQKEKNK
ncbi:hypothetical protein M0813_27268 [Anaeramoeba flamelloides]|uniref:BTB domain-containing protein n=1 Tax=Anaeramoeba flamelloides TaxID=1746091 RepID=A0ABQ8XYM5_9EUKA|nr:hypothetical protein M0813_27268 [Anaeramoeba flamelloides]